MKNSQNFDEYFRKCWQILKILNFWRILTKFSEFWENFCPNSDVQKFVWFGPSAIELFNSGPDRVCRLRLWRRCPQKDDHPLAGGDRESRGEAAAKTLVEKFDTELFSDFSAKSSNFRRLVLSCINADFCVQILILQRFSRSTRFSHLCTARDSKSSQIFVKLFHICAEIYVKIAIFSAIFIEVCTNFNENFSEFRWII